MQTYVHEIVYTVYRNSAINVADRLSPRKLLNRYNKLLENRLNSVLNKDNVCFKVNYIKHG